jgi:hypothetical protein
MGINPGSAGMSKSNAGARHKKARPEPSSPAYVDRRFAADYLGLAEQTLNNDQVTGKLNVPFYRFGRAVRYRLDELEAWAAARRVER